MLTLGEGRLPTGAKLRFLKVAPTYRAWGFVVPIPSQFCPLVQEIQSLWGLVGSRNQLRELGGGGAGGSWGKPEKACFLPTQMSAPGTQNLYRATCQCFFKSSRKSRS